MIWESASPLLLYPEWIILVLLGLQCFSLATLAMLWMQLRHLHRILPTLREYEQEIAKLRALNGNLRSDYEKLRANNEKLGREYAELWREHQETCDILGPMLDDEDAESEKNLPSPGDRD